MDNSVKALCSIANDLCNTANELKKLRRSIEKQTDIMAQIANSISELNEGKEEAKCQEQ